MTEQKAKQILIDWCNAQVGTREGANNWNKYAEDFRLQQLYGWRAQNQPWCDIFTDAGFIECFGLTAAAAMTYQPIGQGSAACRYSAQFFKDAGAWYGTPETGDVIFFYYDGAINHQGIVVSVGNGLVATVEGNSSDAVRRGVYSTASSYIAGYGRPNWAAVSSNSSDSATAGENTKPSAPEPVKEKTCKAEWTFPVLGQGDKGSWVKIMQIRLMAKGYSLPRWGADGDFGNETRNAVERFQKDKGLVIDSVVGQATWKALGE